MVDPLSDTSSNSGRLAREDPSNRLAFIQGLRAVAVLLVVLFHAGVPGLAGFIGVDVFFVISGFVITAMLTRELKRNSRISFRAFYLKRFKRLAPALSTMLVAVLIVSIFLLSPFGAQQQAATTAMGATLFFANFAIALNTGNYFSDTSHLNPLLNTWSLSVEEQIYFIFPALLFFTWVLAKKKHLKYLPVISVAVCGLLSFVLAIIGSTGTYVGRGAFLLGFYSPLTRFWEFAVGACIALCLPWIASRSKGLGFVTSLGGLVLLLSGLLLIKESTPFPGVWTLLPVLGTALLIYGGLQGINPVNRTLSLRPLTKIGDWSYSIYLWHWPMIVFAAALWPNSNIVLYLAAAISFIPALSAYALIETPLRGISLETFRRKLILILVTVAVPISIAMVMLFACNQSYWSQNILNARNQVAVEHLGFDSPCAGLTGGQEVDPNSCEIVEENRGKPLYLVGDSYAEQFTEPVAAVAKNLDRSAFRFTSGGCPFADISILNANDVATEWRPGCREHFVKTAQWLQEAAPGTVILANAEFYTRSPIFAVSRTGNPATNKEDEKIDLYASGLLDTIQNLNAAGHEVLLVSPIPNYALATEELSLANWKGADSCSMISLLRGDCSNGLDTSLDLIASRQGALWQAIDTVALESNTPIVNFTKNLCPQNQCRIVRDGVWVFKDYLHLTVGGSEALTPQLQNAVVSIRH